MEPGQKVHYVGNQYKRPENGMVKFTGDNGLVFVVFNCGGDWNNYRNYTSAGCRLEDLRLGWFEESELPEGVEVQHE